MINGTVKFFNAQKGYGFIAPEGGGKDAFVHISALETKAKVQLDKDGDGFKVSRSDLSLSATVAGIDEARFREIAEGAKANCPISKLLNAEIGFEFTLNG